ncbi:Uncharacterised protein [Mycobacteroides abscessus subsp. abscessus]|nr:Uncharacterised protein [Mycobacteroides abscessus subsp. abscessus]
MARVISRIFNSGKRFAMARVGFTSSSARLRSMAQESAFPPAEMQSAAV